MARATILSADQRAPGAVATRAAHDLAARLPHLALEARRVSAFVNGVHGRRRPGPGETFWQYRMLTPGEPVSGIDWRRSGRDDRLYVREREWEASHTIWLWMDRSASMGFASALARATKLDRGLVLGLALADALVDGGERVGLMGLTRPIASRQVVEKLIGHIALDKAGLDTDLPPAKPVPRLDEAILISDWLSSTEEVVARLETIGGLGGRGHLVLIVDPIEETFPFQGQVELAETELGLKLDVGDAASWGDLYRTRLTRHRDMLAATCRRLGWTMTLHRTDRPASEAALKVAALIASARLARAA